jgi:hypothetical protein
MNLSKTILILFFCLCLIASVANFLDAYYLGIISRLFLIPVIFIYYYINTKKINLFIVFILFFNFISEFILAFGFDNYNILAVMLPNFIFYLFFIIIGYKDMVKFKPTKLNFASLFIVVAFVLYLYVSTVSMFSIDRNDFTLPFSIYGFLLALLSIIASYNVNFRNRPHDLFYLFCVSGFVITDILYVVDKYYYYNVVTHLLNSVLQMITYYFIVKYILLKDSVELSDKSKDTLDND